MLRVSVTIATISSVVTHQQATVLIPTEMRTAEANAWPATNNGKIKEMRKNLLLRAGREDSEYKFEDN